MLGLGVTSRWRTGLKSGVWCHSCLSASTSGMSDNDVMGSNCKAVVSRIVLMTELDRMVEWKY